ncbi:hypothetical protein LGK95_14930 [Clostridium algoriphilum]|uniref:collagen-like triple helix repeat-containing protein n=1 Tax=Clostridium algoriphilum TaxID=198347 RepID=UPI001CF388E3|nr:collagen-like protein [Clostridium algoriphilum]MCB2294792.1 hypothetical protein [Clostridium algoriphilum]
MNKDEVNYIEGEKKYYWHSLNKSHPDKCDKNHCPTSVTSPTGSSGTDGITGSTGASGTNGINGSDGFNGPTGASGTNGINGSDGITGSTGASGTNGISGGLSAFAYIYSTAAQSVADTGSVLFNNPPTTSSPITFTAPSTTINLTPPGTYLISFELSVSSGGGTWTIAVNGSITQPLSYTSRSENSQVFGEAIITIIVPSAISIVNNSGGSINLANGLSPTPNTSVSASVTILKLR